MATYKSKSALLSAIQREMYSAMEETVDKSFQDLHENVDHFYAKPEGRYHRTGQLKASPQIDAENYNGDTAIAQISINTSTQYDPAGRDTATIYGYAEDNELIGNGEFWRKTLYEIEENMNKAFGKRFKKV